MTNSIPRVSKLICVETNRDEFMRYFGFKFYPIFKYRMGEPQTPGVQHLAFKTLGAASVEFIARNGMAQVLQVHPNLMSPPGE